MAPPPSFHRIAAMFAALLAPAAPLYAGSDGGLTPAKQPVIQRQEYMLDVDPNMAPASAEAARLVGWLDALEPRYGDRVSLDLAGQLSPGRAGDILTETLARYGMIRSPDRPASATPVAPGRIRVILHRATAYVPNCPDTKGIGMADYGNKGIPGLGCAMNGNLASMIADPNDLLAGRASPPGDGWQAARDARASASSENAASSSSHSLAGAVPE